MNIDVIITACVGLLSSICSGWITWFFTRKKYNSEVDHNIIDNMKESLEFYEKLSNDNKDRLSEALRENKALRDDLNKIQEENRQLKKSVDEIKDQMIKMATSICFDLSCKLRQEFPTVELTKSENNK